MPKLSRITLKYGQTVPMGAYASFRADAEISLDMMPGDEEHVSEICQAGWDMLSENIRYQYTKVLEKQGKRQVTGTGHEYYLGLTVSLDPNDGRYRVWTEVEDEKEKEQYNADSGS